MFIFDIDDDVLTDDVLSDDDTFIGPVSMKDEN